MNPDAVPDDAAVAALLRERPGFLAERPELYAVLVPPERVHGERLADHMAAMIAAARRETAAAEGRAETILAAGRAAAGLAERVQLAVLALLAAADPLDCVAAELPALLGVDAAALCLEPARSSRDDLEPARSSRDDLEPARSSRDDTWPRTREPRTREIARRADMRTLPPGAIASLLGGRDVVLRERPADAGMLHAEAAMLAARDALIRVPFGGVALLALVSRDERALAAGQGIGALAFLGRVLGLVLTRRA